LLFFLVQTGVDPGSPIVARASANAQPLLIARASADARPLLIATHRDVSPGCRDSHRERQYNAFFCGVSPGQALAKGETCRAPARSSNAAIAAAA